VTKRRPLRYRGLSAARVDQLQPIARALRRLVRWLLLNGESRHGL
jgi:hypothetical protein